MRKKTHALTASEKPKLKLMYRSWAGFCDATVVMTVVPSLGFDDMFATCVPAKAKNYQNEESAFVNLKGMLSKQASGEDV